MRVLHVSSYFAPASAYGGPPRTIFGLCAALQRVGIDVEVFTTTADGECDLPTSDDGGSRLEGIRVRYFPRAAPRRFFGASGMREALEREISTFDLVHVHGIWNVPGWLAIARCRAKGVPYVLSPRGMLDAGSFGHHRLRKEVGYRLRERRNLRGASLLHATSPREAETLLGLKLGPEVVVVPNGLDPPPRRERRDFRVRREVPEHARIVAFLGRLHPTKRLDLLTEAFRLAHRVVPDSVLVLAGRPDGVHPDSLGIGPDVRWLGVLDEDDKWELLSESNVLVLCSDSESFGMSVLEALSAGVPAVATRTCPWEELELERCGLWVPQEVGAIAEGIRRILTDPVLARGMGERGRALVDRRYRWSAIGREMAGHYERVTDRRTRS